MCCVGRVGTASRHSCLEVGAAPRATLVEIISGGGWQPRVAGGWIGRRSKGNRRPDDWLGQEHIQVSGLGHQVPGSGIQVQVQVRELRHRPISGGGWQPQVAGGGRSAICPLSSMQSSIQPSTQPSLCLFPTANRQPLTANRYHLPHLLSSCPLFLRPSIFRKCPPSSLPSKSAP